MKKGMMLIVALLCAATVNAYEIKDNPDRRISFGLSYDKQNINGDYSFGSFKITDFTKQDFYYFQGDVMVPVSPFCTLTLGYRYIGGTNTTFLNEKVDYKGY